MGAFGMTVKADAADTGSSFSLLEAAEPPGFGPPMHTHEDAGEAFYVLEGEYLIFMQDQEYLCPAGSFVFMDTLYREIGAKSNPQSYDDFGMALTVLTTVISKRHPEQCTIDCGNKALLKPTDRVKGREDVKVENQGAEYGILRWKDGDRDFRLGERVEIYPSNLDNSTNVYDRYYVAQGEKIVDIWPIMGRTGAAQR